MNDDVKDIFRALQNYEAAVAPDDWEIISEQLSLNNNRQEVAHLQSVLLNYEYPVDANDWGNINRQLQQRKKRKSAAIWFSATAAAAAVAVFLLLLRYPVSMENPLPPTATPAATVNCTPKPTNEPIQMVASTPTAKSQPVAVPHASLYAKNQQKNELPTAASAPKINSDINEIDTITTTETTTTRTEKIADAVEAIAKAAPSFPDSLSAFPLFESPLPDKNKNSQKWAIALLAGQSAYSNQPLNGSNADHSYSSSPNDGGSYEGNNGLSPSSAAENYLEEAITSQHHVPLSAGITFRFYFTSRCAVESGLVYSYLASSYSLPNQAEVKQRLHYLGIPISLAYQLAKGKRFSLYASGGCMMEKGLTANYTYSHLTEKNTTHEAIDGIQWSLNGQLGVEYNFYKRFNIYIEPGMRYFLPDSNQPTSIRTEQPLNFNINVGVRVDF